MLNNWIKKWVAKKELAELARIKRDALELADKLYGMDQAAIATEVFGLVFPDGLLVKKLRKLTQPQSFRDLIAPEGAGGAGGPGHPTRLMHTAPRDSTPVWLVFHNGRAIRAHFSGGKGAWLHLSNGEGILPSTMAQVSGWCYLNERNGD